MRWFVGVLAVVLIIGLALSGCTSVGAWTGRPDGSECRDVRPLLGLGRGYSQCRSQTCLDPMTGRFVRCER